jgi:HD-like signal output (HDOD) protein
MRIECPNCRGISAISSDLIVTEKRALELDCSKCKMNLRIQLTLPAEIDPAISQRASAPDPATRLNARAIQTEDDSRMTSLKSKILRSLVELPPMPNIILKAHEIMQDPGSSLKDLAGVIEHDQAIVARVLALANSAYYGLSGLVSSIQHASILLGQKTLGELITIAASSRLLNKKLTGYHLHPGDLWKHSLAVAFGSKIVAEKTNAEWAEDAFIAGLLHDAGKIILDPYVVERKKAFKKALDNGQPKLIDAEKEILGFDHAEVMSRAARFWRYPESQSTAIRYHHSPLRSGNCELAFIVHLANFAAKEAGFKSADGEPPPEIKPQILSHLGFQKEDLNHTIAQISVSVEKLVIEFQ